MLGALVYLRATSFINAVRWRARRLRQPKYLVGAIVGVAYFYFFFFRRIGAGRPMPVYNPPAGSAGRIHLIGSAVPGGWLPIVLSIAALVLLVVLVLMWMVPTGRAALGFSEEEIAFLFPAPITRRTLVQFRLVSAQLRSLTGALVMAVITNRWSALGGNALTHAIGWWFIFSTLNLHFTGSTFTLTRLSDRGIGTTRRRILVLVAFAAVLAVTWQRLPPLPAIAGDDPFGSFKLVGNGLSAMAATAPLSWLIFPVRLVLAPFFAAETHRFLLALAPALLVIVVHYFWVLGTVVSFEEASIDRAEKRAARIAARAGQPRGFRLPTRGRAAPFRLPSLGRPELAFLWKNLLSTWPYFNLRVLGACAAVIAGASAWAKSHTMGAGVAVAGWVALVSAGYVLVIGPQFARQDIRSDMRNVDILKTYPLAGWQIVLGELLTPVAILTGVVWLALLTVVLDIEAGQQLRWLTHEVRWSAGVGLAVVVPAIVMLQLMVPNAAALLFPGWVESIRARGGGPEVMGQRMIYFFAQLLTMIVALLPAAVMAGVLLFVTVNWIGLPYFVAVWIASAAVFVVLALEIAGGLWWLGGRFEKIDVSAELRS